MSFLEMLDVVNERPDRARARSRSRSITTAARASAASCALMINGVPHGPSAATTTCQLHMRRFKDGDDDLRSSRGARGRSRSSRTSSSTAARSTASSRPAASSRCNTGGAPDAQRDPDPEGRRRRARWTPPRASAAAPASPPARTPRRCSSSRAKISHLALLPQGQPERDRRVPWRWSRRWTRRGFGNCTNDGECEAACPKEISVDIIAQMNRDFVHASFAHRGDESKADGAG